VLAYKARTKRNINDYNDNEVLQVYEQDKQNRQHDKNTITDRCYRFHRSSSGFTSIIVLLQILTWYHKAPSIYVKVAFRVYSFKVQRLL